MANTKISNLTGAASVTDASVFPVVDSGSTKKVTGTQIKTYARTGLSTVAVSGSYNDLSNKPTLFDGNYDSLTNKPTIPSLTGYATESYVTEAVAGVSVITDYNDLTNKPIIDDTTSLTGGDFFIAKDETTIQLGQWAAQAITIGSTGIQLSSDTVLLTTTDNISTTHLLLDSESGASLTTNHNIEISAGNGATLTYNIWLDAETLWELVRDEDASIIAPGTRTWAGLPSYEAYPLLMQFLPNVPNGEIPPASNMAPTAKTASDAHVAWQEELAATSVAVSTADNTWFFKADGTLTVPGSITMNERLTLNSVGVESGYTAAVLADGNLGRVFVRTLGGTDATLQTWEFNKEGQLMLPAGGDIVDNAGQSVLGGGGAANTGDITFVNNSMIGTGDVIIGFDQVASPAVTFSFTQTGEFIAPKVVTGSVTTNQVDMYYTRQVSDDTNVTCPPNVDTIIHTGTDQWQHTFKLLLKVEGNEDPAQQGWDTQSCEMMIAKSYRSNAIAGSVYGLVYTSTNPLATFTTRWNSAINRVEVLCRPSSTTENVVVRSFVTEMTSSD